MHCIVPYMTISIGVRLNYAQKAVSYLDISQQTTKSICFRYVKPSDIV